MDLQKVLDALWNNWAFRLSLSSNELFHSNALQYLAERRMTAPPKGAPGAHEDDRPDEEGADSEPEVMAAEAAKRLLDILSPNAEGAVAAAMEKLTHTDEGLVYVKREWNDMDLVVLERVRNKTKDKVVTYAPGRPLFALEIKVKDYATAEQLLEYRKVLDGKWRNGSKKASARNHTADYAPPLFLLAGSGNEAVRDKRLEGTPTIGIDFGCISNTLPQWADKRTASNPFFSEYVDLCQSLDRLFEILDKGLVGNLSWRAAREIGAQLQPYRLHSLWWKLWAAHLRRACEASVEISCLAAPFLDDFHSHSGFTNTGNVGAYWHWQDPPRNEVSRRGMPKKAISIGVQIQGNSFRLFLNLVGAELGSKAKSRFETEAALVRLVQQHGVFEANPGMKALRTRWGKPARNGRQYRNAFTWESHKAHAEERATPSKLFKDVEPGRGNAVEGEMPMLPGYANGPGNGFADIRLTLADDSTLDGVADLVRQILLDDVFSMPRTGPGLKPLLLQASQGFQEATSVLDWIKAPKLTRDPSRPQLVQCQPEELASRVQAGEVSAGLDDPA